MAAPLVKTIALRLLRDVGVQSIESSMPGGQVVPLERGDTDDIALVMTAALQVMWDAQPAELRMQQGSAYLHAPTAVTLSVGEGSKAISVFTSYVAWMAGCTVRIDGDAQDNEIVSETSLARHFNGTSGSKSATVYADAVLLDETTGKIMEPVFGVSPSYWPLVPAGSMNEFAQMANWPLLANGYGFSADGFSGFWLFSRKPTSAQPTVWYQDGVYNSALAYVPRRIRFSPMPTGKTVVSYTALMNAPRVLATDIESDTDIALPIADGRVESIYLPICRQMITGLPTFRNEAAKPEIARAYKQAMNDLINSAGSRTPLCASYPR